MKESKFVILGAGLAGLSTAYFLGGDYLLFERSDQVGGLCRSENTDGFTLDFCVHVLYHKDHDIRELCDSILGENSKDHIRSTWIYSKNVYTQYPFQANLYGLPLDVVEECITSFIDVKFSETKSSQASNFDEWNNMIFGKGIAKHFMTPFNQKLWTVHPSRMSTEWVEGVVPQPEIEDIIDGALPGKKRLFGYNASFRYPLKGGIQCIADGLLGRIDGVHYHHEAVEIDPDNKTVRFKDQDELVKYDKLISTLPLKYMPLMIKGVPDTVKSECGKLLHNSVECVNVAVDRPIEMNRHWIYFPEPDYIFYRIMLPHTLSPHMVPKGKGAFSVEVSHGNERLMSMRDVSESVLDGLKRAKLMEPDEAPLFIETLSLPCAYSIYTKERPNAIRTIKGYLEDNDIFSIGRYGNWEYSNMEKALMDGKELAAKLTVTDV